MDTRKLATTSLFAGGILSFTIAIAPPMDAKVNYRLDDRTGSSPSWLVPAGAEFKALEPGYGALKFPSALLGTALMGGATCLARKFGAEEDLRQKLKKHRQQVTEHQSAAQAAYEMALTQQRYQTLLQADQVAFEGEVEQAYLESIGANPNAVHQAALPGTSLDQITNPGDKVREAEVNPAIADTRGDAIAEPASTPDTSTTWEQQFTNQTALIWGNQGGGKSWIARYFAKLKKQQGYRVIVLDPDSNRSEWLGVESHHTFEDIEKTIRWYVGELERRYREFNESNVSEDAWRSRLWTEGKAIALITEEMTTYTDFIRDKELLSKFVRLGLTKSRKQEMPITFVAHNNTQSCLGDITGLKNLIDRMLQLQCVATVDPVTLQPRSSGKGKVKLDGSSEWLDVSLPRIGRKITDFLTDTPAPKQRRIDPRKHDPEYFERVYNLEFDIRDSASLADKPDLSDERSDKPDLSDELKPLSNNMSGFVWSVRKVRESYPDQTPEELFQSVSASAQSGVNAREIIKNVLKCYAGNDHPTRSYTRHGKTLLRWLIENYDDGAIASLPVIKKFLEDAA